MARSKADIWMPLYIGDYLSDTAHLSTEQSGAYLHLLMHYWKTGPLPNNDIALAQITKLSLDAWSIAQAVLKPFFMVNGDGKLHQKRIDEELKGWQAKKQKAKEKASKAAEVRWKHDAPSNAPSNASGNQQAMLEQCPLSSPSPIKLKTIARFTSSDDERVYAEYPRKVGKGAALKAIHAALNRLDSPDPVAYLIGVTKEFAKSPAGQRGEFTPHPKTFYSQSRYLDDPEEWEKVR